MKKAIYVSIVLASCILFLCGCDLFDRKVTCTIDTTNMGMNANIKTVGKFRNDTLYKETAVMTFGEEGNAQQMCNTLKRANTPGIDIKCNGNEVTITTDIEKANQATGKNESYTRLDYINKMQNTGYTCK